MKGSAAGLALAGLLVALGGGGYLFYQGAQREAEIAGLAEEIERELAREEAGRSDLTRLLRKATKSEAGADDPRVIRGRARLQLKLDQLQAAWETVAVLATDPDRGKPADHLLGATILKRMHALQGGSELAARAMSLAEQHYDATGAAASLFLAWQCAHRATRDSDSERLATRLLEDLPETWEARVVRALREADPAKPQASRATLATLEREAESVPEELDLAMAFIELNEGSDHSVDSGATRLGEVLDTFPACVDARSLLVGVLAQRGETAERDSHLRWLLQHAAPDDRRRRTWQRLLDG